MSRGKRPEPMYLLLLGEDTIWFSFGYQYFRDGVKLDNLEWRDKIKTEERGIFKMAHVKCR